MPREYVVDSDENSDFLYDTIEKIVTEIGPRGAGTLGEKKAAKLLNKELQKSCDTVKNQEFWIYPRAFLGWFKIIIPSLLLAFIIFLFSDMNPILISLISIGLTIFGSFCLYKQFMRYEEWTPKFLPYKREVSQNVVGIIKPEGEVKKRVVVGGHYDSAFIFNIIHYTHQGYAYFIFAGILLLIQFATIFILKFAVTLLSINETGIAVAYNWVMLIYPYFMFTLLLLISNVEKIGDLIIGGAINYVDKHTWFVIGSVTIYNILIDIALFQYAFTNPNLNKTIVFIFFTQLPAIIVLFFYWSKRANLGVCDNLTAVASAMLVAKILKDWKKHPEYGKKLKNTEVVIGLFGSEEVGLRGSHYFAKTHAEEYNKIDTTCVNMETLQESRIQTIYEREATTDTNMSPEVYNLLVECCKELNIPYRLGTMPSIAGGTDATGLIKGGLKATTLEGLRYKDYLSYYHTTRDNLEMVNKERRPPEDIGTNWKSRNIRAAMEMAVKIIIRYIEKKDEEAQKEK